MDTAHPPSLTPKRMLSLPRPQQGIPNPDGNLALWPASTFDFEVNHGKGRTDRTLYLVDLSTPDKHVADGDRDDFPPTPPPRPFLSGLASLDAAWLDPNTVLFLRPAVPKGHAAHVNEKGQRVDHTSDEAYKRLNSGSKALERGEGTEVWAKEVDSGGEYRVGKLPVPISDLSLHLSTTSAILAFSATVYSDGSIWTVSRQAEEAASRAAGSDAKVYDGLFVRHWDEWAPTEGERKQVHFVRLERAPSDAAADGEGESDSDASLEEFEIVEKEVDQEGKVGGWRMTMEVREDEAGVLSQQPKVVSPLAGTSLECPVGPFGGASDYSLSSTHLLFHSKDPNLNPAYHTRHQVYLVPLTPRSSSDAKPRQLTLGTQGATSSPTLSPDGKRAAWLEMREDGYEADRNRVMVYEIETGKRWGATETWDRSPGGVVWSEDGLGLLLTTEEEGHVKLCYLEVPVEGKGDIDPIKLTHDHAVTGVSVVPSSASSTAAAASTKKGSSTLLVTQSSLRSPNQLSLLTFTLPTSSSSSQPPKVSLTPLASLTHHLLSPLSLHAGEEFWFAGDKGQAVHGWITFPPELAEERRKTQERDEGEGGVGQEGSSKRKWPLAFLCHGGPQSAWEDAWSTRWNPNVFASHGYITVAINRTGSTGFGQDFCDKIKGDWGGAPFRDLVAGLQFVTDAYPEIDPERTACLGASYGGYMVNWIQGHNQQMGFKCLVCHDGVFSPAQTWNATEELYFPEREFGGLPWEVPEKYQQWSPQNHIKKWQTPQLVIHGSKDYRLVEGEGLGVFNTLQRLNIPSRLLIFPSENHWVLNPRNSNRWHEEVFRWLDEWTAPSSSVPSPSPSPADSNIATPAQPEPTIHIGLPSAREVSRPGYQVEYREIGGEEGA
ncbi:hypothetical protein JCM11641_006133 [Rhodosporidiobolus odoratus]